MPSTSSQRASLWYLALLDQITQYFPAQGSIGHTAWLRPSQWMFAGILSTHNGVLNQVRTSAADKDKIPKTKSCFKIQK